MRKAVIYARISTNSTLQDNRRQVRDLKIFAERNDIEITGVFNEEMSGATRTDTRPGFIELSKFIEENNIKLILVSEVSRLGRNTVQALQTMEELHANGVCVYVHQSGSYTLRPDGTVEPTTELLLTVMAGLAKQERSQFIERVNSGIANAKAKGKIFGQQPYGFKKDNAGGYAIDSGAAKIVKEIFAIFLEKKSFTQTAKTLNLKGYKTSQNKQFGLKSVKTILTCDKLTGWLTMGSQKIEIPQIIDLQTFERVQRIITKTKTDQSDKNRKTPSPLKGLLICADCGRNLSPLFSKHYVSQYKCSTDHNRYFQTDLKACSSISVDMLNNILIDVSLWAANSGELLSGKVDELRAEAGEIRNSIEAANGRIKQTEKSIEKEKLMFKADVITIDDLKFNVNKLNTTLARQKQDKDDFIQRLEELNSAMERMKNPVSASGEIYSSMAAFKSFCQANLFNVTVKKYGPEADETQLFRKHVHQRNNSIVYRIQIEARLFTVTLYCSSHTNKYVLEAPKVILPMGQKSYELTDEFYPLDMAKVYQWEKRLMFSPE